MRRYGFVGNLVSLYGVQIASLIFPLVTLPYLARVLRPEALGEFAAVQALAITLSLIVEYGFAFSATRQVALNRDDLSKLASIADQVLSTKIALCIFTILLSFLLKIFVPEYSGNPLLFGFGILYAIAQGFSPLWYFQGIEELSRAAVVEVICRAISTTLLFLLVKSPEQGWLVMALQASFLFLAMLINHKTLYSRVDLKVPSVQQATRGMIEGWSMFLFRAAVSLYTTANVAILRLFVPSIAVAEYSNADKLVNAAKSGLQPITQILFPRISYLLENDRHEALKLIRKSSLILMSFAILVTFVIWISAPIFVPWFLGSKYRGSIQILQILSLSIPIIAFSNILGIQWMLPHKMDKIFNIFILSAGLVNIALISFLVPRFGNRGMAYAVIISEVFIDICMVAYLIWKDNFPFQNKTVRSEA